MNLRLTRLPLACACATLFASGMQAGTLTFFVNLDTSALSSGAAPYSLDFQLIQGGLVTNSVLLTGFTFTNGNPTGSPTQIGGATGDLSSSVSLTDSSTAYNEFFQAFSPSTTKISFKAQMTANVDPSNSPDSFSMAILDKSLNNIPTAGVGDSMLQVNISITNPTLANVITTPAGGVGLSVTAIPEPASGLMVLTAGLVAVGSRAIRARRRSAE